MKPTLLGTRWRHTLRVWLFGLTCIQYDCRDCEFGQSIIRDSSQRTKIYFPALNLIFHFCWSLVGGGIMHQHVDNFTLTSIGIYSSLTRPRSISHKPHYFYFWSWQVLSKKLTRKDLQKQQCRRKHCFIISTILGCCYQSLCVIIQFRSLTLCEAPIILCTNPT